MNPPGDSILLLTLLALVLASCGYYFGRLHHRHQSEVDREEAYRDGYDMATRSVFSLAARVIGPRRSTTRNIVPPQPVSPENMPPENMPPMNTPPVKPEPTVDTAPVGFPVPPPPPPHVVAEPAAPGGVTYQPFPNPRKAEEATEAAKAKEPEGRHTVPDALIEGTTYRLPPDRIFRAKVNGANLPEEPTTHIAVPKPRER